ncbi:MAG TPA: TolC family protein [Gemmatimonadales bacterium]
MRRLTLVLACCASPLAKASPQQRAVTLAEAIDLAVRADPSVVQAQGTARTAGATLRSTWGEFLPRISSNASYGKSFSSLPSRTDPLTGEVISGNVTSGSLTLGGSAQLDLFTGFRRGADLSNARAGIADADASLGDLRAQSALRTSNQFIQTLQSADLVRVQLEAIRRAEDKLAIANAKLATRAATIADSLGAVVDVARARATLLTQQRNLTEAEATLARYIGLDGRVSAVADSSLFATTTIADSAALMGEAMSRSPAVLRAEARVRANRANVGIYKSSYWPALLLSASTSLNGSSQSSYDLSSTRGFNLGLSWNLFNGFARERNLVQANANLDYAVATAADERRRVGALLTTQLAALQIAEQRIALTAQSLEAARASSRVQTERYRLGSIGIVELNLAQDALSNAEVDAINARYEYLRAKAQIEAILGRRL